MFDRQHLTVGPYIGQLHSGQQFGQWIPTFRGGGLVALRTMTWAYRCTFGNAKTTSHRTANGTAPVPTPNCTDYKGPYWDRSIIPQKMCSKFGFVPLPYWIVALKVLLVQVLFQTFGCMSLQCRWLGHARNYDIVVVAIPMAHQQSGASEERRGAATNDHGTCRMMHTY